MTAGVAVVSQRLATTSGAERAVAAVVIGAWAGLVALAAIFPNHQDRFAPGESWLVHPMLMTAATMLPLAMPGLRFVLDQSLRRRRNQAAIAYAAVFWGGWILVALAVAIVMALVSTMGNIGWRLVPLSLLTAAAWQALPARSTISRSCGKAVPLPPAGRVALLADVEFGLLSVARCAGTCWPLMLVMAAAPTSIPIAAAAAAVALVDRYSETARRRPWLLALGYAVMAGALLGADATPAARFVQFACGIAR
jgi:predicted metal-binding membrane protein